MKNISKYLDLIQKYQRPVRSVIWVILITFAFLYCLTSFEACNDGFVVETALLAMFADMGIYSILRTVEKRKNYSPVVKKEDNGK